MQKASSFDEAFLMMVGEERIWNKPNPRPSGPLLSKEMDALPSYAVHLVIIRF